MYVTTVTCDQLYETTATRAPHVQRRTDELRTCVRDRQELRGRNVFWENRTRTTEEFRAYDTDTANNFQQNAQQIKNKPKQMPSGQIQRNEPRLSTQQNVQLINESLTPGVTRYLARC
ncbi:hypothetical protein CBL_10746 [Carabus blaptoides fortunei]